LTAVVKEAGRAGIAGVVDDVVVVAPDALVAGGVADASVAFRSVSAGFTWKTCGINKHT
jgi:hypothetical protein